MPRQTLHLHQSNYENGEQNIYTGYIRQFSGLVASYCITPTPTPSHVVHKCILLILLPLETCWDQLLISRQNSVSPSLMDASDLSALRLW